MRYSGKRCNYEGHKFASELERDAWIQLTNKYDQVLMQPKFTIQDSFRHVDKKIPAITYTADFQIGNMIIDVKPCYISKKTGKLIIMVATEAALKIKMFKYKYGSLFDFRIMYRLKKEWYLK